MIEVEVAFARPDVQRLIVVTVPTGTQVREILVRSKLADEFPEIDPVTCPVGIFGRVVGDECMPQAGDRVEVYRPLQLDPKEARRERARRKLDDG